MCIRLLLIEFVGFLLLSILIKNIRNYKLYFWVLEKSKITINEVLSIKESVAYYVTKIVVDAPSFSFAPDDYEYWKHDTEKKYATTNCEKVINFVIGLVLFIKSVLGNIIYDVIFVLTILHSNGYVSIPGIKNAICNLLNGELLESIIKNTMTIFEWIQGNVNLLLVSIVVYFVWSERKKKNYAIEAVWAEEDADIVREVAKIQKELEDTLLQIRYDIYQNMIKIKEGLRCASEIKEKQNLSMNDYSKTTEKIKELLIQISRVKGIQIFAQRNRQMYVQLMILELSPSLPEKKCFINLDRLSKQYIESNCDKRNDWCKEYAYGVAFMNGINRFLRFSYKKRKQYSRIMMHITDMNYVKSVVEYASK